jgi:hypothetical protein
LSVAHVHDFAAAFEKAFARKLLEAVSTPEEAVMMRPDRWVDVVLAALRDLGKERSLEVFPIRRGVADLGWELVWGRNLLVDYPRLSRTAPPELFALDLVAEVSEGSFRPGTKPERAVEEVANDLAKLLWARAPLKLLAFGARREAEPANALASLDAGLAGVIEARDKESDYLFVALPILEGAQKVDPAKATLWLRTFSRGRGETPREVALSKLLSS